VNEIVGLYYKTFYGRNYSNKLMCLSLSVTSALAYYCQARLEPTLIRLQSNRRPLALIVNMTVTGS